MHWFSGARFDRYCPNWRIPPLEVTNDRSIYGFCAAQFDLSWRKKLIANKAIERRENKAESVMRTSVMVGGGLVNVLQCRTGRTRRTRRLERVASEQVAKTQNVQGKQGDSVETRSLGRPRHTRQVS